MNKTMRLSLLIVFSIAAGLLYFWLDSADAARLGRGRSFGSKPSYQRSAPAPTQNPASHQTNPGQTASQRPASRGWGGMLGGLLVGGLIGSLLFGGHGFAGPGLLDLLFLGGGLFLLMRFLRSRRKAAESPFAAGPLPFETGSAQPSDIHGWSPAAAQAAAGAAGQPMLPQGFDADEFLKGASAIYTRLQSSWDRRDLSDIRQFTSPEVFAEIQGQTQQDPEPGKTELLLVKPRIVEVREVGGQTIASVLYDVLMREDGDELSKQVRELWHFSRDRSQPEAFWVLEGIQQIEQ